MIYFTYKQDVQGGRQTYHFRLNHAEQDLPFNISDLEPPNQ